MRSVLRQVVYLVIKSGYDDSVNVSASQNSLNTFQLSYLIVYFAHHFNDETLIGKHLRHESLIRFEFGCNDGSEDFPDSIDELGGVGEFG